MKKSQILAQNIRFLETTFYLRFRDATLHGPFKVHYLKKNNGLKGTNMSLKGCTDSVNSPTTNIIYQAKTSWSIFSQVMQNVAVLEYFHFMLLNTSPSLQFGGKYCIFNSNTHIWQLQLLCSFLIQDIIN